MVSKNDQIDYLEHHLNWAERKNKRTKRNNRTEKQRN